MESSSTNPPSPPQLLLFFVLLIWLAAAAIVAGMAAAFLPSTWPEAARSSLVVALLAALLLIPFGGFALLTRRPGWTAACPLALILVGVGVYITIDAVIRAIAGPPQAEGTYLLPLSGTTLRLILLTPAALLLGGIGVWWSGGLRSRGELRHALGLNLPGPLGLLLSLAAIAILTLGWPLTGALGDSWTTQLLLIQTLAQTLPEELFFRGALLALLLTFNVQRSTFNVRFWPLALFTYLAFTPSLIVPHGDWAKLTWLFTALPLTWLLLELRR
ncbi:MAG: hypothetical protein HC875_40300 [Anaerolineales bacterium]|nr:hypothetical protein [Anaerolineales bacterium]